MILSIITINLNNAKGLQKTLDSLYSQDFKDYEHIIIDGSSKDSSLEIIKSHEKKLFEKNINIKWLSEPDSGIYNAMNKGIELSSGIYCLFLNSGDYLTDNILQKISLENYHESFIYGNLLISKEDKIIGDHIGKSTLSFMSLYQSEIKHQATFIKRVLFEKYGKYNESYKIIADWEFFLKTIGLNNENYAYVNHYITVFDNDGISNNPQKFSLIKAERDEIAKRLIPPIFLYDYERFSKFLFVEKALNMGLPLLLIRIISKFTKIYLRIIHN